MYIIVFLTLLIIKQSKRVKREWVSILEKEVAIKTNDEVLLCVQSAKC